MKLKTRFFVFAVFLASLAFTTCDMVMVLDRVSNKTGSREISESERDELEKNGHYLKLVNLPLNTQVPNVFSVSVSNSLSAIAKLHKDNYILIFKEKDGEDNYSSCTVYLPLSYKDDKEFTETGNFYTAFSIHVDALVKYVVEEADHFIVYYSDGRGQADVNDLHSSPSAGSKELTEKEKNDLEKTGRFLKLLNMPLNTQAPNVFSVSVSNSSSSVAKLNKNDAIFIFKESNACTVYLPLVYNDDKEFTETGYFYTAFAIHIDAVNKYVVEASDRFLVYYSDGRGEADANALPAPPSAGSKELTEKEKNELEKTGRFLKLLNMPLNTQVPNVFSVSVSNSSSSIAKLNKNDTIFIFKESNACTVYLPLVYNDDKEFTETGYFFTAFTIHIDALTKYVVEPKDEFIVFYSDGRGEADVNALPAASAPEPSFLTVTNLPASVSVFNFSGVSVRNQTEVVAKCKDYSQIDLSPSNGKTSAKIPLHYNSLDKFFQETGVFYVSFDINVDVDTRYTLTDKDQVKIPFIAGNGSLDIQNIPEKPVPYLTIKGLPLNTTKHQASNVNVYNSTSSVAGCSDVNSVVFYQENNLLTFLFPLKSSSGGDFLNSGEYYISFLFNIDVNNKIEITLSDKVLLCFTNGSAEFDVKSTYGFFNASLNNPDDYAKPVIKGGSSFDVNGHRASISGNFDVPAITPEFSCFLYLYAYYVDNNFYYEFSNTPPVFNPARNGWYNGVKRALWKMIYLYNSSPPKYLFKTDMNHDFPQFGKYTVDAAYDYTQLISGKSALRSIDGAGNPSSQNFSLSPGVYIVELKGAGGGKASGGSALGGAGGLVREIITLNSSAAFTAFTGSSGGDAPSVSNSGAFKIITTKNYYKYVNSFHDGGHQSISSSTLVQTNTLLDLINLLNNFDPNYFDSAGGGGGGGGSGSFLYSSEGKYLLVAGGGGGASGASFLTPGGGGGTGGTVGPGSGGGGSGSLSLSDNIGTASLSQWNTPYFNFPGCPGGAGGGLGGGSGGPAGGSSNGGNGTTVLASNSSRDGGKGSSSYSDPGPSISSKIPFLYQSEIGTADNSDYGHTPVLTSNGIASLRTKFSFSAKSGDGGSPAVINYVGEPNSWQNTLSVGGLGASATPLYPLSVSGSITVPKNNQESSAHPGQISSNWTETLNQTSSILSFYIGYMQSAQEGGSGGNNRNSSRAGGGSSGQAGSIAIYKIY